MLRGCRRLTQTNESRQLSLEPVLTTPEHEAELVANLLSLAAASPDNRLRSAALPMIAARPVLGLSLRMAVWPVLTTSEAEVGLTLGFARHFSRSTDQQQQQQPR